MTFGISSAQSKSVNLPKALAVTTILAIASYLIMEKLVLACKT